MTLTGFLLIHVAQDLRSHSESSWVQATEVILSSFIILDIILKRIVYGQSIYRDCWLWVDITILTFFTACLVFFTIRKLNSDISDELDLSFLCLRYIIQGARFLSYLAKATWHMMKKIDTEDIVLEENASSCNSQKNIAVELTKSFF